MKKFRTLLSCVLILLLISASIPFSVSAASDYVVEDGVLTEYKGNSKDIVIPSIVYYIADSVFMDNKQIRSVNLNGVSIIGNNAFSGCTSLETVTGYNNVESCGAYAFFNTPFQNNRSDKTLIMGSVLVNSTASGAYTVPSGVKSISSYAFVNNTGLTSVTIGDSVSSIGEGAFYGCSKLSSVSVSSAVSYIGPFAFEGSKFLTSKTDQFVILGNGILVDVNTTSSSIKIPSSVKQIAAGVFYQNKTLSSVEIPDSVTAIGMRAFSGCTSLSTVTLPDSLVLLDKEAFYQCTSLKGAVIPKSVEVIGDSVYLGCTALATVRNLSSAPISSGMFAGCTSLKYLMNPNTSVSVGSYAFYNCKALTEISLPGTVSYINPNAFNGCNKGMTVHCYLNSYSADYFDNMGINVFEMGDANSDGKLNIKDASHIQKATAGMLNLSFSDTLKADADLNATINIRDATRVQKVLAGLI